MEWAKPMAELIPTERLQPCLLDRLTDDEPQVAMESRSQRVVSPQRYRRGVFRDLEWLFNAAAHPAEAGVVGFEIADWPEVARSVLNFGTRQLGGATAPDLIELERHLTEVIRIFEPRVIARSIKVSAQRERNVITFELVGELWANPIPEGLYVRTVVDVETGQCVLGDGAHG